MHDLSARCEQGWMMGRGELLKPFAVAIERCDMGAFGEQVLGKGTAKAGGGAGDECGFLAKLHWR
jgi:hypothetical protein